VIVKPDAPLVPVDQTVIKDAQRLQAPMVAATHTDFGGVRVAYVFAYPRGSDTTVSFQPGSLGLHGAVYVYNYLTNTGRLMDSTELFTEAITGAYSYYIATPIGESGIGLLGDAGHFVSLGRQRITRVADDGILEVTIAFAPGEGSRIIHGYSPGPPAVTALRGDAEVPAYDPSTHLFSVGVSGDAGGSAVIHINVSRASMVRPEGRVVSSG
jgi:hypothetical protein